MNFTPTENTEWVVSLEPNQFIVVLENKTDLLEGIPFVAFVLELGAQEPTDGGMYDTETKVHGLRQLDGVYPGAEIPKTTESKAFLDASVPGIEAALNAWEVQPDEIKERCWGNNLERALNAILGKLKA